jgi:hypothetical protein
MTCLEVVAKTSTAEAELSLAMTCLEVVAKTSSAETAEELMAIVKSRHRLLHRYKFHRDKHNRLHLQLHNHYQQQSRE